MNTTYSGLSSSKAAQRLNEDGFNELPGDKPRQAIKIIVDVISEPMFLLLLGAAGIYLVLGDLREALVLCSSIFIIVIITFIQERRTENTLARLRDLTSPRALVIRDGNAIRIAGREVVAGDIVLLREGDRVPADALLHESTAIAVDESILTGESLPVEKLSGTDKANTVYAGSMIISGYGTAEVIATGVRSQIGKIGKDLQSIKTESTPLYREVNRLVKQVAIGGIALCVIVAVVYAVTHGQWLTGLLAGITVAMGVLPEEFPVVLTVFLAMGAWRISKRNVLTRRMPAIESLGAATVLCVDKTGTLTENKMRVAVIQIADQQHDLRSPAMSLEDDARRLLSVAMAASERDAFDPMEQAIHDAARRLAVNESSRYDTMSLIREYDLTPQLLAVTHVWQGIDSTCEVACKGAPETVMQLCQLDLEQKQRLHADINALAEQGLRVLAVARAFCNADSLPDSPTQFNMQFVGLLCLADPIRSTVPAALKECAHAGIRVVMITGDHAGTALTIARQAGFDPQSIVLACSDMDAMTDEVLRECVRNVNIFARATPQHKLRLVQALKANDEIVVMTGDGVNDAPALKAAHVGVAMGGRGTDVAREAAAVVLLDDEFASLVDGVRLGRRIYDNIKNAMHYLVAVHIPLAGIGLLPVLFGWPLVFFPLHVLFLEFVIDPACSFVFEADPESVDVMRRKPRSPAVSLFSASRMKRSIMMGSINLVLTVGVYGIALRWLTELQARALCFATLVLGNIVLMLLSRTRHDSLSAVITRRNLAFWTIASIALLALWLTIYVPAIANLFHFASPPLITIYGLFCLVALVLATIVITSRNAKI